MRKLSALVLGGFLGFNSCSSAIHLPSRYLYDLEGKKVNFVERPDHPHGASVYYDDFNRPIISYDPSWLAGFPQEFQTFLIYHEHGHIVLGHLKQNPFTRTRSQFTKNQYEADCYSIKHLKDSLYYTSEQFQAIYDWADIIFETTDRADNLKRCL